MVANRQQEVNFDYDTSLPDKKPFMWIEREEVVDVGPVGEVRLIAYGAFNAMGLIGPEKGGVAVVCDDPKFVIATKDIPHDMMKRRKEFERLSSALKAVATVASKLYESTDAKVAETETKLRFLTALEEVGYNLRIDV